MNIAVEKSGMRDGKERFILVNSKTGKEITLGDVSEPTMRGWLSKKGFDDPLNDECLTKARKRYDKTELSDTDFEYFLSDLVDDEL